MSQNWNSRAVDASGRPRGRGVFLSLQHMENHLVGKTTDRTVTLRNGAKVDVGTAAGWLEFLRGLAGSHAEHFRAICAISSGEGSDVAPEIISELQASGVVTETGELRSAVRDVLASAYSRNSDGGVFESPFAPEGERERRLLLANDANYARRADKLARKLGLRDDRGGHGGHGR